MEIEDALAAALADSTSRVTELKRQLQELEVERRGLELALARYRREASTVRAPTPRRQSGPPVEALTSEWTTLGISDAVYRVLVEADEALSPTEIVERLSEAGRTDDNDQVRAALTYLRRRGYAERPGHGQWETVSGDGPTDAESPTLDVGLSVPDPSIREGGDANGTGSDRDHDEDSSRQAINRVHDHGASVEEAL